MCSFYQHHHPNASCSPQQALGHTHAISSLMWCGVSTSRTKNTVHHISYLILLHTQISSTKTLLTLGISTPIPIPIPIPIPTPNLIPTITTQLTTQFSCLYNDTSISSPPPNHIPH